MGERNQQFNSHAEWVNFASRWLTNHPRYNNTEHSKNKPWRGEHFSALCFDAKGRRCRNGGDFKRAHDENSFPVKWLWPDQIDNHLLDIHEKELNT